MPDARDVLDFIKWVEMLMWREEYRLDPTHEWQRDMSWAEMDRDAEIMAPGEVEKPGYLDKYLPEYTGLLTVQLYWPATGP